MDTKDCCGVKRIISILEKFSAFKEFSLLWVDIAKELGLPEEEIAKFNTADVPVEEISVSNGLREIVEKWVAQRKNEMISLEQESLHAVASENSTEEELDSDDYQMDDDDEEHDLDDHQIDNEDDQDLQQMEHEIDPDDNPSENEFEPNDYQMENEYDSDDQRSEDEFNLRRYEYEFNYQSDPGSENESPSPEATTSSTLPPNTSEAPKLDKIQCNTSKVIGRGCHGTFVYCGTFEGREVAVKRILPACFPDAEREVELLKESDQHENVVRYFCTESDSTFLYIALEFCEASLDVWVKGDYDNDSLDGVKLLEETSKGLAHLHSLRIVHRDVKPANVLISKDGKAKVSDFGLSKKIKTGGKGVTFTGVRGTDGWIAPEMLLANGSDAESIEMTPAMDVFSLGCIFYFVLSKGGHPFGYNLFSLQSNIIDDNSDFSRISDNPRGADALVKRMISKNPTERPTVSILLKHPMFWTVEKVFNFLEDVSDWMKGLSGTDPNFATEFDQNGEFVLLGNWKDHMSDSVKRWVTKYKGKSLQDLLRAVRNTKHHREEKGPEIQAELGNGDMDKFVMYWLSRFPKLLPHTWEAMRGKASPKFKNYC